MNYATMEHGPHACSQNYAQANHISYVYAVVWGGGYSS
jgi:hypothetical protein